MRPHLVLYQYSGLSVNNFYEYKESLIGIVAKAKTFAYSSELWEKQFVLPRIVCRIVPERDAGQTEHICYNKDFLMQFHLEV